MTDKQPEALRLAEHIEISATHASAVREKTAAELRRLHEENEALRARLAQPEPEPVAWMYNGNLHEFDPSDWAEGEVIPLYTAQPQRECVSCAGLCCQDYEKCNLPCTPRGREQARREWQTLTENEIKHLWYEACQTNLELTSQLIVHLARNIEAKLKEKNT